VSRDKALYVAWRESRYRPSAYNATGDAAGIYQHLVRYWPQRAEVYGFKNWSPFNARANVFVTMRMVRHYGWAPWGG
jgi:muramidase (phage lysozyme)